MIPHSTATRIKHLAPLVLTWFSAAVAAAAYLQVLNAPFISDDILYITSNAKLAGLRLSELWQLLVEPYNGASEYLPLRELSYWLDMTLFGQNPAAFRLHNIFLYLLCLPLVYGITLELWLYFLPADAASASWASAVVTALFALHPTHAEAVVWIAGRKDVLSGMFSLFALWLETTTRTCYILCDSNAGCVVGGDVLKSNVCCRGDHYHPALGGVLAQQFVWKPTTLHVAVGSCKHATGSVRCPDIRDADYAKSPHLFRD